MKRNSSNSKFAVIGAGSYGTALAYAIHSTGFNPCFWVRRSEQATEINNQNTNRQYFDELPLPPNWRAETSLDTALNSTLYIVYSAPSGYFSTFLKNFKNSKDWNQKILVNSAKGFDLENKKLLHESVQEILGDDFLKNNFLHLSGPSFAHEMIKKMPTCVTISGHNPELLVNAQETLGSNRFRLYRSNDLVAAQTGGAIKNVVAIAIGVAEGLGLGQNTKSAIITHGLNEITRIGVALGAQKESFLGFSGVGDLVLTCSSAMSRNFRFGQYLGQGLNINESIKKVNGTIEGINATKALKEIPGIINVHKPICDKVFEVLFEAKPVKDAIKELLNQPFRSEQI